MQYTIQSKETGEIIFWVDQNTKRYIIDKDYDVLEGENLTLDDTSDADFEDYEAHIVGEECTETPEESGEEDEDEDEEDIISYTFDDIFNKLYDYRKGEFDADTSV